VPYINQSKILGTRIKLIQGFRLCIHPVESRIKICINPRILTPLNNCRVTSHANLPVTSKSDLARYVLAGERSSLFRHEGRNQRPRNDSSRKNVKQPVATHLNNDLTGVSASLYRFAWRTISNITSKPMKVRDAYPTSMHSFHFTLAFSSCPSCLRGDIPLS